MSSDRKRILLVEPEPVLAEITAFRLELLGYDVTSVQSAEEALTRVGDVDPDLIITDVQMPEIDEIQATGKQCFCARIQWNDANPSM